MPMPCPAAPGAWQSPVAQPPCTARACDAPGQKAIVSHLCPAQQLSPELALLSAQSRHCRVLQPFRLQLSLGESLWDPGSCPRPPTPTCWEVAASCMQGRLSTLGKSLTASWKTSGRCHLSGCRRFRGSGEGGSQQEETSLPVRPAPGLASVASPTAVCLWAGTGEQPAWHSSLHLGGRGRLGAGMCPAHQSRLS